MGNRAQLQDRIAAEFDDPKLAAAVMARVGDETVEAVVAMCGGGDVSADVALSFQPPTIPVSEVSTVMAFSYGYRWADRRGGRQSEVPPIEALLPGPVNERLGEHIAEFVQHHPVTVVAQWEIARVLDELGVVDVVSVEPDLGDDGSTIYLSTAGVLDKGLGLLDGDLDELGRLAVFAHHDHAPRCVATARHLGIDAGVVATGEAALGRGLPRAYDPQSGQRWTRDRATWIATDLFARTRLAASTDWTAFSV